MYGSKKSDIQDPCTSGRENQSSEPLIDTGGEKSSPKFPCFPTGTGIRSPDSRRSVLRGYWDDMGPRNSPNSGPVVLGSRSSVFSHGRSKSFGSEAAIHEWGFSKFPKHADDSLYPGSVSVLSMAKADSSADFESSGGSPPTKRKRLGWGQGLAKYEKKVEVIREDSPARNNVVMESSGELAQKELEVALSQNTSLAPSIDNEMKTSCKQCFVGEADCQSVKPDDPSDVRDQDLNQYADSHGEEKPDELVLSADVGNGNCCVGALSSEEISFDARPTNSDKKDLVPETERIAEEFKEENVEKLNSAVTVASALELSVLGNSDLLSVLKTPVADSSVVLPLKPGAHDDGAGTFERGQPSSPNQSVDKVDILLILEKMDLRIEGIRVTVQKLASLEVQVLAVLEVSCLLSAVELEDVRKQLHALLPELPILKTVSLDPPHEANEGGIAEFSDLPLAGENLNLLKPVGSGMELSNEELVKAFQSDTIYLPSCQQVILSVIVTNRFLRQEADSIALHHPCPLGHGLLSPFLVQSPGWKWNEERHSLAVENLQDRLSVLRSVYVSLEHCLATKYRVLKDSWLSARQNEEIEKNKLPLKCGPGRGKTGPIVQHAVRELAATVYPLSADGHKSKTGKWLAKLKGKEYYVSSSLQMPAMFLHSRNAGFHNYLSSNSLVEDPFGLEQERQMIRPWSEEERKIYYEKFAEYGREFARLASFLPNRTVGDCVDFYYLNKKCEGFPKPPNAEREKQANYMAAKRPRGIRDRMANALVELPRLQGFPRGMRTSGQRPREESNPALVFSPSSIEGVDEEGNEASSVEKAEEELGSFPVPNGVDQSDAELVVGDTLTHEKAPALKLTKSEYSSVDACPPNVIEVILALPAAQTLVTMASALRSPSASSPLPVTHTTAAHVDFELHLPLVLDVEEEKNVIKSVLKSSKDPLSNSNEKAVISVVESKGAEFPVSGIRTGLEVKKELKQNGVAAGKAEKRSKDAKQTQAKAAGKPSRGPGRPPKEKKGASKKRAEPVNAVGATVEGSKVLDSREFSLPENLRFEISQLPLARPQTSLTVSQQENSAMPANLSTSFASDKRSVNDILLDKLQTMSQLNPDSGAPMANSFFSQSLHSPFPNLSSLLPQSTSAFLSQSDHAFMQPQDQRMKNLADYLQKDANRRPEGLPSQGVHDVKLFGQSLLSQPQPQVQKTPENFSHSGSWSHLASANRPLQIMDGLNANGSGQGLEFLSKVSRDSNPWSHFGGITNFGGGSSGSRSLDRSAAGMETVFRAVADTRLESLHSAQQMFGNQRIDDKGKAATIMELAAKSQNFGLSSSFNGFRKDGKPGS